MNEFRKNILNSPKQDHLQILKCLELLDKRLEKLENVIFGAKSSLTIEEFNQQYNVNFDQTFVDMKKYTKAICDVISLDIEVLEDIPDWKIKIKNMCQKDCKDLCFTEEGIGSDGVCTTGVVKTAEILAKHPFFNLKDNETNEN